MIGTTCVTIAGGGLVAAAAQPPQSALHSHQLHQSQNHVLSNQHLQNAHHHQQQQQQLHHHNQFINSQVGAQILSPVVGATATATPIIFANGQAYQIQGQYAIPIPPHEVAKLIQMGHITQIPAPGAPTLSNGMFFYEFNRWIETIFNRDRSFMNTTELA
jgi:hypothetical protein